MRTGNTTDLLLESAFRGDEAAFDAIHSRFRGRLEHYVSDRMGRRLASAMDPQDLVQEVFAEVFTRIDRFEPRGAGTFYKLLVTIANRRLANAARRLASRPDERASPSAEGAIAEIPSPETGPLTALLRAEDREL